MCFFANAEYSPRLYTVASAGDKVQYHAARDDGGYLTRHVNSYGVHEQKVLVILFKSHFVDDTRGHGESGYARRAYHGVDLL